jgi:hypothetical protein
MRSRSSLQGGQVGNKPDPTTAPKHPAAPGTTRGLRLAPGLPRKLCDWLTLAWALWWFWAYVQGALAERFPHVLGWTRRLW